MLCDKCSAPQYYLNLLTIFGEEQFPPISDLLSQLNQLFYTLIRLHIKYCMTSWVNMKPLENIHHYQ